MHDIANSVPVDASSVRVTQGTNINTILSFVEAGAAEDGLARGVLTHGP